MKRYKGYSYPELKDLYADEEKYTVDDMWEYQIDVVKLKISKDAGAKEVDEIFRKFIDETMDSIYNIANGFGELSEQVGKDPTKKFIDIVYKQISLDDFASVEIEVEGDTPEEQEANFKKVQEKLQKAYMENPVIDGPVEEEQEEDPNKLSEEDVEKIVEATEEVKESSEELKKVAELPSSNGKVERSPEEVTETGEMKKMMTTVDPDTGNSIISGPAEEEDLETFEELIERINNSDEGFDTSKDITKEDIDEFMEKEQNAESLASILGSAEDMMKNPENITKLIDIANRRKNKEDFNVYKEFPDDIKKIVDSYVSDITGGMPIHSVKVNTFRNKASEALIDDFILNVNLDKAKKDFSKEVEDIFNKGVADISEDIVGYTQKKIAYYRDKLQNIKDPEKRERLATILDQIDKAYSLEDLKEYAKRCKIKKFDIEKPNKIFTRFMNKYRESAYDIYSIDLCIKGLMRHLNSEDPEAYTLNDVYAFFICFCKYTTNYDSNNIIDHTFIYYVIYNIVLCDVNISENTKDVSDTFLNNVKECIDNLKARNKSVL